ncbi:hypothetical protein HYH02_013914 [Chlamydomonas schloesseri]|uniref:Uncharacterized protein n=1 Tax=Chlamydomonas schloesseri TaxID=2026947 RepID=A0A835SUF0_9CHLO|nr:hypothetical protein HYH02_013914 [Chlamydomonas schloesseri]|eukprot:KAG2429963.1 hypothetical protein HYH02_013914 [Chlamydomonas schloesseri]
MAHSGRRERRWALLAVLILAAAANNLDKYAPVKGANAPQTNSSEASCSPRQAFSATIKTKRMSAWAKAIIQGGIAAAACAKHDTVAACYADAKNYCGHNGEVCTSGLSEKLQNDVLCPGAPYTKYMVCSRKRRTECGAGADRSRPDADGCVVSDWGGYWGKSLYEQYGPADEAATGGKNLFGVCFTTGELAARLGSNNEYNATSYEAWSAWVSGDSSNLADFYRARGNCSYAKNAVARNVYAAGCSAQNLIYADATKALRALNASSNAALTCAANGCTTTPYSGVKASNRYQSSKLKDVVPVYEVCEMDQSVMWAYRLNPKTDGPLMRQYEQCYSPTVQRSKALCEGVVVV